MYLLNNMIANRTFQLIMGESISCKKTLNNGLAQGSVLAPLLFALYLSDIPDTTSRKFGYDDWALATVSKTLKEGEDVLKEDLNVMGKYFRQWRLKPNPSKTEVCCFHLHNACAKNQLKVHFEGQLVKHNFNPKYLGVSVTLDRSLTFKCHLYKTAQKLKTRNNIIQKLCGSSWGSSTPVLRTSVLALVYSVAEYCAPVWLNSCHVNAVDTQLNNSMRIISGAIRPTPLHWLPILSHIAPANLRRQKHLLKRILQSEWQ
jgi:Reverse transcriptase (RNA-dependent DNA polymerase).